MKIIQFHSILFNRVLRRCASPPCSSSSRSAMSLQPSSRKRSQRPPRPAREPKRRSSRAAWSLVERFDIEPFSDFSAKRANFIGLVLFCIDAKFCNKICVGKLLTRSTRFTCFCTPQTSIFQKIFVKLFRIFWQFFAKTRYFWILFIDFCSDFDELLSEFRR